MASPPRNDPDKPGKPDWMLMLFFAVALVAATRTCIVDRRYPYVNPALRPSMQKHYYIYVPELENLTNAPSSTAD